MNSYTALLANFIALAGSGVSYDRVKATACNVDIEDVNDPFLDNVDGLFTGFLHSIGVSSQNVQDMIGGSETYSIATLDGVAELFDEVGEDALNGKAVDFLAKYEDDETTLDGISPIKCKSGYKRKKVMKAGKLSWKCIRLAGKTKMSPAQKNALRKARMKAHTGIAKLRRKKSHKIGTRKGLY